MLLMETEDIKFNPSDYSYLDNIPFAGWMWEFIRRSPEYRKKYDDIKNTSEIAHLLTKEKRRMFVYEQTFSRGKNHLYSKLTNLEKDNFVRPLIVFDADEDSEHFLLLGIEQRPSTFVGIPKPTSKYCDFLEKRSFVQGAKAVLWFTFSDDIEKLSREVLAYYLKSITHLNSENTLYIGISLGANPKDVQEELNIVLDKNIKSKKRKPRMDKWKYYLMIYDAVKNGLKMSKISEILSSYIEDLDEAAKFGSERKIRLHYSRAESLIRGEYKKYLNLPS